MNLKTIDVRTVPPQNRHALIFQAFDDLKTGEGLELINDHDPGPLQYQFNVERPEEFSWNYLEKGPQTWRVKISRTKESEAKDGGCCGLCGG